jgi:hypothetical protein
MAASLPNAQMDQRIFKLGLAVETISAYLLCCALADEGHPVTRSGLLQVWNADPDTLDRALADLVERAILETTDPAGEYRISPTSAWRRA